jgi:ribosomal protein S18 acetylase RimI-like enzyme
MSTTRTARRGDLPRLGSIEVAAGEQFRSVGLGDVADHAPPSIAEYEEYLRAGRLWVAIDERDVPIGYVIVDIVDGNAHVEQVSVLPEHQRRGAGRALLDRVRDYAAANALPMITLATYDDVAWNRPLYEHLGFRVMREDEIGHELVAVVQAEAEYGLDPDRRVCMCMHVPA